MLVFKTTERASGQKSSPGGRRALHATTSLWSTGQLEPHLSFPAPLTVMLSRFTVEPFVVQKPIIPRDSHPLCAHSVSFLLSPDPSVLCSVFTKPCTGPNTPMLSPASLRLRRYSCLGAHSLLSVWLVPLRGSFWEPRVESRLCPVHGKDRMVQLQNFRSCSNLRCTCLVLLLTLSL